MLPTIRHRCNIQVWVLALSRGDWHCSVCSLVTTERGLSENNKDLIFLLSSNYLLGLIKQVTQHSAQVRIELLESFELWFIFLFVILTFFTNIRMSYTKSGIMIS